MLAPRLRVCASCRLLACSPANIDPGRAKTFQAGNTSPG
jgi:hypothetical protein